jgi:secreted trypsin-like serine protease
LIVTTTGAGLCGASVISQNAVLTAAHCTSAAVTEYLIIAGAYNRLQVEPQQQRRFVPTSAFIPHPNYSTAFLWNDVAVIRVGTPFVFNQYVSPIILASDDSEQHVNAEVTVSGN